MKAIRGLRGLGAGVAVATLLSSAGGWATAAAASSTPTSKSATSSQTMQAGSSNDVPAGTTFKLPNGHRARLPKAWSKMSIQDLSAIGLHPGMGRVAQVKPAVRFSPNSASGCNADVCIQVGGSGLKVDYWNTQGLLRGGSCTYSAYWENGRVVATGWEICSGPGRYAGFREDAPLYYWGRTQICNTWVSVSGKPCETVHS